MSVRTGTWTGPGRLVRRPSARTCGLRALDVRLRLAQLGQQRVGLLLLGQGRVEQLLDLVQPDQLRPAAQRAVARDLVVLDRLRQRLGLRAGLAVVGLVEEVADLRILEQALVHAPGDVQSVGLEGGHGGLDESDGGRGERGGHRQLSKVH